MSSVVYRDEWVHCSPHNTFLLCADAKATEREHEDAMQALADEKAAALAARPEPHEHMKVDEALSHLLCCVFLAA